MRYNSLIKDLLAIGREAVKRKMPKKLLFIYNPCAGKAHIGNELVEIIDIFTKGGYDVVAHPTQAQMDAFNVIQEHGSEYDIIVVSGGDGTLSEAVEGLMLLPDKDKIHLGYIPSGSTNDFAVSLGIPKNMKDAAEIIVKGKPFKCDIGRFNNKKFNYVAGFGAFTDVSYETPQETKNMFGHLAYIFEGISRLTSITSYAMKVTYDDNKIVGEFVLGMVLNTNSIAGFNGENMIKAELNDGLLELLLIKAPSNIIELQGVIAGLLRGETEGNGFLLTKVRNVVFETEDDIKWTLDGEFGGNDKKVEISVIEEAVNFIV